MLDLGSPIVLTMLAAERQTRLKKEMEHAGLRALRAASRRGGRRSPLARLSLRLRGWRPAAAETVTTADVATTSAQ
jgi:hypothetical protein